MKINPQPTNIVPGEKAVSAGASPPDRNELSATQGPAPVQAGPGKDSIHISELSSQLHALESHLSANGSFDPAKVDQIKQAIRDGSMTVNPEAVADKMIAGLQEMFSKA